MLTWTLLVLLLTPIVWSHHEVDDTFCGCATESVESFHGQRIPSRITEKYCRQPGTSCMDDQHRVSLSFWVLKKIMWRFFFQCEQLSGVLEVGYTQNITNPDVETVVFKRNLTFGTGCVCAPLRIQRVIQNEKIDRL